MIVTTVPRSPGWWMLRLARKLEGRQPRLNKLDAYFRGDPPMPEGAENAKESYKAFQRKARTNFAELVVEAPLDRMVPTGFQTGAAGDENGDVEAQKVWYGNGLEVESAEVHRMMLSMGDAYVIVGGPDEDTDIPVITAEDPRQVVTEHDPRQQRKVLAALKMFHDTTEGRDFAYLYLRGPKGGNARVYVASKKIRRTAKVPAVRFSAGGWDWDEARGGEDGEELPGITQVPVVRFRNKRGVGEFESHLDLLDRINHMILQRMVIATLQAFRQRAIKVSAEDMPEKDDDGNEINYDDVFSADPGALWKLPATAELWESGQVDLTPILSSVKDDVQDLAAVTRTALHYFHPDAANGTAEGASTMREGQVFRTEDRIRRATGSWNQVMSLAFRFAGDAERAELSTLRTLWAPAERFSLAERADAASKAGDLPWRTRMTDIWQFPPERVREMESERMADALVAGLGPAAGAPTPPAPGPTQLELPRADA